MNENVRKLDQATETILEVSRNLQDKPLAPTCCSNGHPYTVGANYFVRTVTHHYTGRLVAVYDKELVLANAAWIADDGRFSQAVKDGSFSEIEPYPDEALVIVSRGAILDAVQIRFPLPRSQK